MKRIGMMMMVWCMCVGIAYAQHTTVKNDKNEKVEKFTVSKCIYVGENGETKTVKFDFCYNTVQKHADARQHLEQVCGAVREQVPGQVESEDDERFARQPVRVWDL